MRTITVDQYEFNSSSSEEFLELWIAARGHFPFRTVQSFFASTVGVESGRNIAQGKAFAEHQHGRMIRAYLQRFAGIIVPIPCNWITYELSNNVLDWDAIFETPDLFIRFHWSSSA
jgi:hypothetical protein